MLQRIWRKIKTLLCIINNSGLTGLVKVLKRKFNSRPITGFDELKKYFIDKSGLEIGGPSSIFRKNGLIPIYPLIIKKLDGINFANSTIWTGRINKDDGFMIDGKCFGEQYIFDAVDLTPIKVNSYDFVLSSNNIEHIANPLKAIEQWLSVLKQGGLLVIIAPRKESNFDHKREIVKFKHLISDYDGNVNENDLSHMEEIIRLHDLKMDPPAGTLENFKERCLRNSENRCLHHHVFN